jgi:hypothetical protein
MLKHAPSSAAYAIIALMTLFTGVATQAQTNSSVIDQRVKTSLNEMVQNVHAAETPVEKRAVLDQFLTKVSRGTSVLAAVPFLSEETHAAIKVLSNRFDRYSELLHGHSDANVVADGDLNAFASYMQNDIEQASGGIYLSTGAIIIVLLIILILL